MQNMIQRIIDADNEAKVLEAENRRKAEAQKEEIEKQAKEMYDNYISTAMETVKKNDALEEQKTEKAWQEISAKQNSAMIKLKADFENNRDRWVDEIVSRVIESA
ncbi:MAG: hypothetical protein IIZ23_04595 [Ruminococcus sp.]|nr:hypothetical protein [Ruminococcus sp.]